MAKRKRRNFTPEFKAEVVLEALSGESSQAELCRRHTSAMNNFQSGSDSFLKMRCPSLNPLINTINTLMPLRSGSPNLNNLLDG